MPQPAIRKGLRVSLLSLLGILVLLGAVELCLRAAGFEYAGRDDPVAIWNKDEDRDLRLGRGLHRIAAGQLWEPRPGAALPLEWTGAPERVNSAAFRGPERSRTKPDGVLRIAMLGDSSTFGYGLAYADSFSAQLETRLAEAGVRAEVLDFGVIGFTLLQGLERYTRRVRAYHPDVVVAAFGAVNDHHVAQGPPDKPKIAASAASESRWADWARGARASSRVIQLLARWRDAARGEGAGPSAAELQRRAELEAALPFVGQSDFETAHHGVRRVPVSEFETGLTELAQRVTADGAKLVLVVMPHRPGVEKDSPVLRQYAEAITDFCKRSGTALCDARTDFRIYREVEHGDPTTFFRDADDVHPSQRGHARIARALCTVVAELWRAH